MTDQAPGLDPRTDSPVEPVPDHDGGPPIRWLLFVGGPILFAVHFLVVYLTTEAACTAVPPADDLARTVTVAATAVAVLIAVALTTASHRWWRSMERRRVEGARARPSGNGPSTETEVPDGPDGRDDPGSLRDSALAVTSVMLGALFGLSVLVVGIPALVLPAC